MQLEVQIIKTKRLNATNSITCALMLGGKLQQIIPENIADTMIKLFNLAIKKTIPNKPSKAFDIYYS